MSLGRAAARAAGLALLALPAACDRAAPPDADGEPELAIGPVAVADTQIVIDSTGARLLVVTRRRGPAPREVRPRAGAGDPRAPDAFRILTPAAAHAAMRAAPVPWAVLDVRTSREYVRDGHLPGALLVELDRLTENLDDLHIRTDQVVLVVAGGTPRAHAAAEILAAHGFPHVRVLQGGVPAWRDAGLPVEEAP